MDFIQHDLIHAGPKGAWVALGLAKGVKVIERDVAPARERFLVLKESAFPVWRGPVTTTTG